jgi:hypothetical protein
VGCWSSARWVRLRFVRDVLKALGYSGLFVAGCAVSAIVAISFTLYFADQGPEGERGPRGKSGAIGPRGYSGTSEAGENAEADVINLEGTVESVRSEAEEARYEAEAAISVAEEAELKAREACSASEFVC